MSDQLVAEASDNTQHQQQTNVHASGGIRSHNPSRRAAADLLLRSRSQWDRQCYGFFLLALQPQLGVVFYSPLVGFSLLACEVS